jgi:predicted secreted Zn-dependent protease
MYGELLASLLMLAVGTLDAPIVEGVAVTQTMETYTVSGVTSRSLLRELDANARVSETSGAKTYGSASVYVNWSYNYREQASSCRIDKAKVSLDITLRMPQWQPEREPSQALKAQWQVFHDALTLHELRHRAFGVDAARKIKVALDALSAPSCDALNAEVDRRTGQVMENLSQANRMYDAETSHGRTEGAWWQAN